MFPTAFLIHDNTKFCQHVLPMVDHLEAPKDMTLHCPRVEAIRKVML